MKGTLKPFCQNTQEGRKISKNFISTTFSIYLFISSRSASPSAPFSRRTTSSAGLQQCFSRCATPDNLQQAFNSAYSRRATPAADVQLQTTCSRHATPDNLQQACNSRQPTADVQLRTTCSRRATPDNLQQTCNLQQTASPDYLHQTSISKLWHILDQLKGGKRAPPELLNS